MTYKCQCGEMFETWEKALLHHDQIAGHNIYTNLSADPCPSCATFREKLDREKLTSVIYRCGYPSIKTKARASALAGSLIAYFKE